jgi:hypothetical protein
MNYYHFTPEQIDNLTYKQLGFYAYWAVRNLGKQAMLGPPKMF